MIFRGVRPAHTFATSIERRRAVVGRVDMQGAGFDYNATYTAQVLSMLIVSLLQ